MPAASGRGECRTPFAPQASGPGEPVSTHGPVPPERLALRTPPPRPPAPTRREHLSRYLSSSMAKRPPSGSKLAADWAAHAVGAAQRHTLASEPAEGADSLEMFRLLMRFFWVLFAGLLIRLHGDLLRCAKSIVGQKRWTNIDLAVGPEEFFELLRRGTRRLARWECGLRSPDRRLSNQSFEPCRSTEHKHPRLLAIHTEGVRDPHRHDGCRARHELKPLLPRVQRQLSLLHDVTLVLRMRVKRWRGMSWKEKLDQSKAPITRLGRHPDDRECAEEPELLTFSRTRPRRGHRTHD